jgi:photosystem II stability/assembly factor-like uncharacterized protein
MTACGNAGGNDTAGRGDAMNALTGTGTKWGYRGFGGGGAMFFPAVSPFNTNFALVACDMTGSFVTHDGGASWRMFNLRAPVHFFVFDPVDSNTVYANGPALFKSTDKGNTWTVVYPAASEITAVISKGDHAENVIVTKDSTRRHVQALAIDPSDPGKLYAAIAIDDKTAFYTSSDGGGSWKKETDIQTPTRSIFVDPSSPSNDRTIYIATAGGILSNHNGQWQLHKTPAGVGQLTIYTAGYDSLSKKLIVYAISGRSYFHPGDDASGIFFTDDGGATWDNRQDGISRLNKQGTSLPEWRTIATSAEHPGTVYVSYDNLHQGDTVSIGVAKSQDYGRTWSLVWQDRMSKAGSIPAANLHDGWLNDRYGPTWGENPFCIAIAPHDPDICYATDFGRTIKTIDGGKNWQQVYTRKNGGGWTSRGLEVTTGYQIAVDPFDTAHVFLCVTDVGLMESRDGGYSWNSATKDNGIPNKWVNTTYWLIFDKDVKGKAWAVMSGTHDLPRPKMWRKKGIGEFTGGILTTDDGGKTWRPVSNALGEAAFTHILIDPASDRNARTLYACAFGKGVYKSVDGGKTWALKNNGLPQKEPFAWRITRRDKDGALFLVISRRSERGIGNEEDGAVYRSDDGAATWTRLPLPDGVNGPTSIAIDEDNPEHLLLSAWGRANDTANSPDTNGGIYASDDEGHSWHQTLARDQHIHDITYDKRNKTWYACGFNSSAYRSPDNGNTWQRIKGYNFKWGKRVEPDPVHPGNLYIITFGGGVWYGPDTGDSTDKEDITTPILAYDHE